MSVRSKYVREKLEKLERGGGNTGTWFLNGETTATLKVPYTPSGILKHNVQNVLDKVRGPDGGYTKVVETAGTPVSRLVSGKPDSGCRYVKKCLVGDSDCQTANINYNATCSDCPPPGSSNINPPSLYIGTSGSNIHHRSILHTTDKKSALHKHNDLYHSDSPDNFERFRFRKTNTYNNVLTRVMSEAYQIANSSDKLMNSKNEYGAGKWISLNPTKFTT